MVKGGKNVSPASVAFEVRVLSNAMLARPFPKAPRPRFLGTGLFFALAFAAGAAVAGDAGAPDPKLGEANESAANAIALLKAAQGPKGSESFETHRKKAIDLLTRAQGEILKAKGE
jgi:hypothetical protein